MSSPPPINSSPPVVISSSSRRGIAPPGRRTVVPAAVPAAAAPAAAATRHAGSTRSACARLADLARRSRALFPRPAVPCARWSSAIPCSCAMPAALLVLRLPAARLREPLLLLLREPLLLLLREPLLLLLRDPLDRALLFRLFPAPPRLRDPPRPPRELSPASDRCSSPARAVISSAWSLPTPRCRSDSLICSFCRARLFPGLTPRGGIRLLSRAERSRPQHRSNINATVCSVLEPDIIRDLASRGVMNASTLATPRIRNRVTPRAACHGARFV